MRPFGKGHTTKDKCVLFVRLMYKKVLLKG